MSGAARAFLIPVWGSVEPAGGRREELHPPQGPLHPPSSPRAPRAELLFQVRLGGRPRAIAGDWVPRGKEGRTTGARFFSFSALCPALVAEQKNIFGGLAKPSQKKSIPPSARAPPLLTLSICSSARSFAAAVPFFIAAVVAPVGRRRRRRKIERAPPNPLNPEAARPFHNTHTNTHIDKHATRDPRPPRLF
jgi:hypothetical protein